MPPDDEFKMIIRHGLFILLGVITSLARASGQADELEQPLQEVFQSTLVYAQEQDELQISFFPQYDHGDEFRQWLLPISIEYGLTDALQIELEWTSLVYLDSDDEDKTSGIGDLSIGAFYSWMNINGSTVHAATGLEIEMPTGDEERDLGEGEFVFAPFIVLAMDLPLRADTQVFLNSGIELSDSKEEPFVNLGLFTPLGDTILTMEWNWENEESYFTPGLVWQPLQNWEFGIGTPVGLNAEADNFRVLFNIIYE